MSILLSMIATNSIVFSSDTLLTNKAGDEKKVRKIFQYNLDESVALVGFGGMLNFLQPVKAELDSLSKSKSLSDFVLKAKEISLKYYDAENSSIGALMIGGFEAQTAKIHLLTPDNYFAATTNSQIGTLMYLNPNGIEKIPNWKEGFLKEQKRLETYHNNDVIKIFKDLQKWFADKDPDNTCNYEQHVVVLDNSFKVLEVNR